MSSQNGRRSWTNKTVTRPNAAGLLSNYFGLIVRGYSIHLLHINQQILEKIPSSLPFLPVLTLRLVRLFFFTYGKSRRPSFGSNPNEPHNTPRRFGRKIEENVENLAFISTLGLIDSSPPHSETYSKLKICLYWLQLTFTSRRTLMSYWNNFSCGGPGRIDLFSLGLLIT